MEKLGYGKDYKYAHNYPEHIVEQDHLPKELKGKKYYTPSDSGYERRIRERLQSWAGKKEESSKLERATTSQTTRRSQLLDSCQIQQEDIRERSLVVTLKPPRSAAVSGIHVGLQQETVLVGLERLQAWPPIWPAPSIALVNRGVLR